MTVFDWQNTIKPKAVLFDWDNTLVNTWPVINHALNETFKEFDKPIWSMDETIGRVRLSLRDSFPEIFGNEWQNARDKFYRVFKEIHLEKLEILPKSEELLKYLQNNNFYTGIISNKTGNFLRDEVDYLGWNKYFTTIIGAGDADKDKPEIEPLYMALNNSNIDLGNDVWFVGDCDVDMEIANKGDCIGILLNNNLELKGKLGIFPPNFQFNGCKDFLEALNYI